MARHKKTRQQKIIADLRHSSSVVFPSQVIHNPGAFSLPKSFAKQPQIQTIAVSHSYGYVVSDIKKTALLTLSILLAQLILLYVLKNHLVVLPMISRLY